MIDIDVLHKAVKTALDETLNNEDVIAEFVDQVKKAYTYAIATDNVVDNIMEYMSGNHQDQILSFLTELNFYITSAGISKEDLTEAMRNLISLNSNVPNEKLSELLKGNDEYINNDMVQMFYIIKLCANFITRYYINKNQKSEIQGVKE